MAVSVRNPGSNLTPKLNLHAWPASYTLVEMYTITKIARPACVLFFGCSILLAVGPAIAQSPALPVTPPTSVPAATPVPAQPVVHRAHVVYAQGKLQVDADNSSLNQILRDIAQQTGMKITGGVTEQRVFGKYGPGPASAILAALLDGAGSNVMLRENPDHTPLELILTPRNGGPTPPSPSSFASEDPAPTISDQPAAQSSPSQPALQSQQTAAPQSPDDLPGVVRRPGAVPVYGPGAANATPPPTSTNPQSPNGVLTPQQLYQQMQQMRSQLP